MIVDMYKYNTVRKALANSGEDNVIITVPPKTFALKAQQDPETIKAAWELLDDPNIRYGITPLRTIETFRDSQIPKEMALYVLILYAVAVKEGWIKHSKITNKYHPNPSHKEAVQYIEDMHGSLMLYD